MTSRSTWCATGWKAIRAARTGSPTPDRVAMSGFVPRHPWRTGDLQTIRNALVRPSYDLARWPGERLLLAMRDGTGDRLAASLHRPDPAHAQTSCPADRRGHRLRGQHLYTRQRDDPARRRLPGLAAQPARIRAVAPDQPRALSRRAQRRLARRRRRAAGRTHRQRPRRRGLFHGHPMDRPLIRVSRCSPGPPRHVFRARSRRTPCQTTRPRSARTPSRWSL